MGSAKLAVELGRRLRELRLKAGLSQAAVGERMEPKTPVFAAYVSRVEAGKAGDLRVSTVVRYLAACNEPKGRFLLALAQDGVFGAKEEPIAIAPPKESEEAKREAARARAREMRRIRKHEARELLSRLEDEIAPVVRPYLTGGHAFRMGAYVSAARAFYRAGQRVLGSAGGFASASALKAEFDGIEQQNPSWLLDPDALRKVRVTVERLLHKAQRSGG